MFLTKKHLSRRTLLHGAGASHRIAAARRDDPRAHRARATPQPRRNARLGFVYFPHGAVQQFWTPKQTGRDFDFSHILKPLEPLRDHVTVVSGLRNKGAENAGAPHFTTEISWLSCVGRRGRNPAGEAGITVDQFAARHIGQGTPLPSLELCTEGGRLYVAFAIARPRSSSRWRAIRARCSTRCSARATTRKSATRS